MAFSLPKGWLVSEVKTNTYYILSKKEDMACNTHIIHLNTNCNLQVFYPSFLAFYNI